jgi:hypothetical protein
VTAGDQHSRSLRERREREAVDAHYERIAVARGLLPPRSRLLFFFKPRAYVLLLEDEPGVFDVARIAVEGWEGKLALCFMSPLDALIEGARIGKPGLRYDIAWAAAIGAQSFAHGRRVCGCGSACVVDGRREPALADAGGRAGSHLQGA